MSNGSPRPIDQFDSVQVYTLERPTELISEIAQQLFQWWLAGPNPVAFERFDPVDHARLLPHLYLMRRMPDARWRIAVQGEEMKALIGRNNAGMVLDPRSTDARERRLVGYYNDLSTAGLPRRCHGSLTRYDRQYRWVESIDLPLVDDARAVCAILGCMVAVAAPDRVARPIDVLYTGPAAPP